MSLGREGRQQLDPSDQSSTEVEVLSGYPPTTSSPGEELQSAVPLLYLPVSCSSMLVVVVLVVEVVVVVAVVLVVVLVEVK